MRRVLGLVLAAALLLGAVALYPLGGFLADEAMVKPVTDTGSVPSVGAVFEVAGWWRDAALLAGASCVLIAGLVLVRSTANPRW